MIPLTILAIGAVVTVPIYLVTKHGKAAKVDPPPLPVAAPEPVDDGIVSQDAVLQFLPPDVVTAVIQSQQPGNDAESQVSPGPTWVRHRHLVSRRALQPLGSGPRPTDMAPAR